MKFESLNLHPDILKGITDAGFEHCTPIQEQSLPECIAGKDVIAQSQTGSGKTAVFLLSIFSRVLEAGPSLTGRPRALVMVPTRELATQVMDDAAKLGRHISFRSVAIYGGVEYDKQIQALKKGVDLVVATPGRMIDLYKSKTLSLDEVGIYVIDEADRMFDMGFAPDMMYIASRLPKNAPRQTMLFSATIDSNVRRLAERYMKPDPVMIEIEPEQVTVNSIEQKVVYVSNEEKIPILLSLLNRADVERCIIFTNMKRTAEMVGWKLTENGLPAKILTGDLTQDRRQKVIDGMKAGTIKILVATDVAARGLHVDGVSHVINYDLPDDAANYVHRIGRTARAGASGKAFSLVCEDHVLNLPEIEKYIERKLESEWIEDDELVKDTASAFSARPRGPKPFDSKGKGKKPEGQHRGQRTGGPKTFTKESRGSAPSVEKKPVPEVGEQKRPLDERGPAKEGLAKEGAKTTHPASKGGKRLSVEVGMERRPVKEGEEKIAGLRPRRPQDRRPLPVKKEGAAGDKPETPGGQRPARPHRSRGSRRPGTQGERSSVDKRMHPHARREGERTSANAERHETKTPATHEKSHPAERSTPHAERAETKKHHEPVHKNEAAIEKKPEKQGILKRFLKFLKKK